MPGSVASLPLQPIGVARSPFAQRVEAPRQANALRETEGTLELFAGRGFEFAVEDLPQWSHLWVLYWFHLNEHWRPKVQPPRSETKRGLFATRAPYRPNPIGLTAVKLLRIDGLRLTVLGADWVDGSPILDLKPYVPYADCIPEANSGWLDDPAPSVPSQRAVDPGARHVVEFSPLAEAQLDWLEERGHPLKEQLRLLLAAGAVPHPYRRIRRIGPGWQIALHEWRARFQVQGERVLVEELGTGYRREQLVEATRPAVHLHRDFVDRFGQL